MEWTLIAVDFRFNVVWEELDVPYNMKIRYKLPILPASFIPPDALVVQPSLNDLFEICYPLSYPHIKSMFDWIRHAYACLFSTSNNSQKAKINSSDSSQNLLYWISLIFWKYCLTLVKVRFLFLKFEYIIKFIYGFKLNT